MITEHLIQRVRSVSYFSGQITSRCELELLTNLNSTQLLSQASKQHVVCAQHRDVIVTSQC